MPCERATPVTDWMPRIDPTPMAKMAAVPPMVIQIFGPLDALPEAWRASASPCQACSSGTGVAETLLEVARMMLEASAAGRGLVVLAGFEARPGTTRLICSWLFSKEVRNSGRAMPETTLRMKAPTTVPARPSCPPMTEATAAAAPPAMTWTGLRPKPFLAGAALSSGSSVPLLPRLVIVRQLCQYSRFCVDGSRNPPKGCPPQRRCTLKGFHAHPGVSPTLPGT